MLYLCMKVGVIVMLGISVYGQQQYDINSDELNAVLRAIIHPDNAQYEMHRQSLQNALENMLASDYLEDEEKRSIATLAKNGQLPSREPDTEMDDDDNGHKRNIASMARSGLIGGKRNIHIARQWQNLNGKRNIGSLMRNNMFPGSEPGKRNVASMAKNGFGTLKFTGSKYMDDVKRNIQALKNQVKGKKKREDGESLEPVMQNGDYDDFLQAFNEDFQNQAEKRFLGGFEKRHIGAMAKNGWMAPFRNNIMTIRLPSQLNRFSRSGRTQSMKDEFSYLLDRRARPIGVTSCRRCEQNFVDNSLELGSVASSVQTRSGFKSSPPRVTALNWRDRF